MVAMSVWRLHSRKGPPADGRDRIHERMLRPLTAMLDWGKQRAAWQRMRARLALMTGTGKV